MIHSMIYSACVIAGASYVVHAMRQPRRICGTACKHPEDPTTPLGGDRYIACLTCPLRSNCTPDAEIKPCGRLKGTPPG